MKKLIARMIFLRMLILRRNIPAFGGE